MEEEDEDEGFLNTEDEDSSEQSEPGDYKEEDDDEEEDGDDMRALKRRKKMKVSTPPATACASLNMSPKTRRLMEFISDINNGTPSLILFSMENKYIVTKGDCCEALQMKTPASTKFVSAVCATVNWLSFNVAPISNEYVVDPIYMDPVLSKAADKGDPKRKIKLLAKKHLKEDLAKGYQLSKTDKWHVPVLHEGIWRLLTCDKKDRTIWFLDPAKNTTNAGRAFLSKTVNQALIGASAQAKIDPPPPPPAPMIGLFGA